MRIGYVKVFARLLFGLVSQSLGLCALGRLTVAYASRRVEKNGPAS